MCEIGGDGLPVATRLMTYTEIDQAGEYRDNQLRDVTPRRVSDREALGYITGCLQSYPDYPKSRFDSMRLDGTPVSVCNAVWRLMTLPIDYLGADIDVGCVWRHYENFLLRDIVSEHARDRAPTAWAEVCGSWLDPVPDLATFFDKCMDVQERVSPEMAERTGTQNGFVCQLTDEARTSIDETRGRCAELIFLNKRARDFARIAELNGFAVVADQVPPEISGTGVLVTC